MYRKPILAALTLLLTTIPVFDGTRPAHGPSPIEWTKDSLTALEVSDVKASAAWYADVLGCEIVLELPQLGWCEVTSPTAGAFIGLGQTKPGEELRTNGGSHLSFGVRNIEKVATYLRSKKVTAEEIFEIEGVVKLLEFQDPDGNRLTVYEELGQN